ncbi:MAG: YrzE family protein [Armatimonadota bacterium]
MDNEKRESRDRDTRDDNVDVGRKGGAASMAAGVPYAETRENVAMWTRDLVRWGPIWAGLLLALAIQVVLGAVGLAVALSSNDPNAANFAENVGRTLSIWSAISALIALFVGGYVAGRMAAVLGLRNGLVQGSVVWALTLVIGLLLSAMGVAGVLGAATNMGALLGQSANLSGPEAQRLVNNTASGTWWFVIGAILAWAAAAGGGILGAAAHREDVTEHK